ncbi:indoleamine 2,3-dioxygenase family protein [Xylariales sp. PMI_506]|nr:indoleamine 2,3-dioxygenase family protein [Xylariales sp. PMI_506]
MSPHAVPVSSADSELDVTQLLSSKYGISVNGFLPDKAPLAVLSDPYYQPWEALISQLSTLLTAGTFREKIDQLEVLTTDKLQSEEEWRRAYTVLAYFTQGYVWGGEKAADRLPLAISAPFLVVAQHFDLPPVLSYAASNLWNFSGTGTDFTDLDSIRCLHTFTGTIDEQWFLMVSVAMEAQAATIIPTMIRALNAVRSREYDLISDALEKLIVCVEKTGNLLERMYEKCDPDTFYNVIRPYLAGSKNMEAAGLPNGVYYPEGPDGAQGSWLQLRGGSNGQSSTIQFFDVVLGVEHKGERDCDKDPQTGAPKKTFHEEVREYMPVPHRRLLVHARHMGSIRELALVPPTTPEQERFCATYKRATETLGVFRSKHITLVTRYIVLPSKRASNALRTKQDLATASATLQTQNGTGDGEPELKGTGGTTLIPFLRQARDETVEAGAGVSATVAA